MYYKKKDVQNNIFTLIINNVYNHVLNQMIINLLIKMEYNVNKNVLMYGIKMIIVIKYVFNLVMYNNYHQKIFKQINVTHKNNVVNIIIYYNKILI